MPVREHESLPGLRYFVSVGVPSLVGPLGAVLVMPSPSGPGIAVVPVAARVGDDGAAELSQQLRDGDGNEFEYAGAAVRGALPGGGRRAGSPCSWTGRP
jgi:hypothetical protein